MKYGEGNENVVAMVESVMRIVVVMGRIAVVIHKDE